MSLFLPISLYVLVIIILMSFLYMRNTTSNKEDNPSFPTSSFPEISANLTTELVIQLAREIGNESPYYDELLWFASTGKLFNFLSKHDDHLLQAYHIPSPSSLSSSSLPPIVFSVGWTETTLKYLRFIHHLHNLGYEVWSFDLRGQGFSSRTGYNKGRYTHINSFEEYTDDLGLFVNNHVLKNNKKKEIIYVGQSLSGLIGLTYSLQPHPKNENENKEIDKSNVNANSDSDTTSSSSRSSNEDRVVIKKMILFSPALRIYVSIYEKFIINTLRYIFGLGQQLLIRFNRDISTLKLNGSIKFTQAWIRMRDMAPANLVIEGPSIGFISEFKAATEVLLVQADRFSELSTVKSLLILQSNIDTVVDNTGTQHFYSKFNTHIHTHPHTHREDVDKKNGSNNSDSNENDENNDSSNSSSSNNNDNDSDNDNDRSSNGRKLISMLKVGNTFHEQLQEDDDLFLDIFREVEKYLHEGSCNSCSNSSSSSKRGRSEGEREKVKRGSVDKKIHTHNSIEEL